MKQTAVEWLIEQLIPKDQHEGIMDIIEEAKEIENQQMIKFAEYVETYPDKNRNVNGEILHAKSKYDGAERTIDLLEQYYNETYGSKGISLQNQSKSKVITELSDEEITKLANEHILYNDSKRQWVIEGMKLYREQLKNKL